MNYEQRFSGKIKVVSFVCSVLVVFLHSHAYKDVSYDIFACHLQFLISRNLAQAAVPFFFALSGFLFYRNFDLSQLTRKWKSRFRSLVIPYLIWNTLYMLVFYFISPLSFVNMPVFALDAHHLTQGILFYGYNGSFWYVFQLIYLTALCPLLYLLLKNKKVATVFLVGIVVLFSTDFRFFVALEIRALVFYSFGAYFALHFPQTVIRSHKVTWVGITAFAVSQVMIYSPWAEAAPVYILTRLAMIVAVWDLSNAIAHIRLPAALDCSFPIFAMHGLPIETLNKLFSFFLSPASNWILVDYFVSTFATIGGCILVNYLLQRYAPKVHAILFGGRAKIPAAR